MKLNNFNKVMIKQPYNTVKPVYKVMIKQPYNTQSNLYKKL